MANFNSQIRVVSSLAKKQSYLSLASSNFLGNTIVTTSWTAITLSGWQTNDWTPSINVASINLLAKTYYLSAYTAITLGGWQQNTWTYELDLASANYLFFKPTGFVESLSRVIAQVNDIRLNSYSQTKVSAQVKYQKATLNDVEAYLDFDEIAKTVDSVLVLSWRGSTTSRNDYVFIEYKDQNSGWQDISNSLNYVVAEDGNDYVMPSFEWDPVLANDEDEEITYDLIIAFDSNLRNIARQIEGIDTNLYQLSYDERLEVGLAYYWAVRAKDSHGGVSDWSVVRAFNTYQFDPNFITTIAGVKRLLVPFSNFEYAWYVGNLKDGLYSYAIYKYNSVSGAQTPIVAPTGGGKLFVVDHSASNPPSIINASYDPQKYMLKFDVKLYDSQFRKYNLKKVEYADQRAKIIGDDPANFDVDAHTWKQIPLNELQGRRRGLESSPFLNEEAILVWSFTGRKDLNKKYSYNVQIGSAATMYQKPFSFAYRNYYNDGTPGDWVIEEFNYEDTQWWSKNSFALTQQELATFLAKPAYFGKANPNGIVMNKTRFNLPSENGMKNIFDFKLFTEDINNPFFEQVGIEKYAIVTPLEFYQADITNILLDLVGVENEYYEMYPVEIQKILDQHKDLSFFWQVQTNDGVELSAWSKARKSDEFNVHHFEWYVKNDTDFGSSDYYVLRAEIELAQEFRTYEFPKFDWMAKINSEIEQYYAQIERLEADMARYTTALQSQNRAYINYLKSRVFSVRLRAYEYLLAQGILSDPATYYNQNVHDKPVFVNGQRTSDLDFDLNSRITERDIKTFNKVISGYEWSSTLYKLRLDSSANFDSQEGRPLREFKSIGRACKNSAYKKCFLTTHDPTSCPWIGKLCPGFSVPIEKLSDTMQAPQPENPQPGYSNPDSSSATYPVIPEKNWGDLFDPGTCPMQSGGPCAKFDVIEHNMQEHTCEVCEEPRYHNFITVSNDGGYSLIDDYYSQINPIGFAGVTILNNAGADLSTDRWSKIASRGQTLKTKPAFLGIELLRSQLPGELNSDILDRKNQAPIVNSYFNEALGVYGNPEDMSIEASGSWRTSPSGVDDKFHIVEII